MALELTFAERRVLGVLLEKGFTTPDQYPLTLNGLVAGCNQKSCREPVASLAEAEVRESLESLRAKGLVTVVRSVGSRTDRFKHRALETLALSDKEGAVLAELLLRGPQTDGELRQRASRMQPIETLAELASIIDGLRRRPERLVVRLGAEGRRRGVKYAHALYPEGESPGDDEVWRPEPPAVAAPAREPVATIPGAEGARQGAAPQAPAPLTPPAAGAGALAEKVQDLGRELDRLKERVEELESTFARFFH